MKRKKKMQGGRLLALALAGLMVLQLAACGKEQGEEDNAPKETQWVWVPEYLDGLEMEYYNTKLMGGNLCYVSTEWEEGADEEDPGHYTTTACRYSLTDGEMTSVPLVWQEDNSHLNNTAFGEDGSVWGITYVATGKVDSDGWDVTAPYLCRFDESGSQTLFQDMSELLGADSENSYIGEMAVDGQGRLYIGAGTVIWLYDAEGNYAGTVSLDNGANSWIRAMGCDRNGRMYVCYYSHSEMSGGYVLAEVDYDNRKMGEPCANIPGGSNGFGPGLEKDLLIYDSSKVYEYDLATQTAEELFGWLDSDINGSYVENIGSMEDGRIVAVVRDWDNSENGIAMLKKTDASQVAQKESIVIATLSNAYSIQSAAVKFNRNNDKYRITIKEYFEYNYENYSPESYMAARTDAITRLNNDITSNNCPDIIDLSEVNVQQLVDKGVFEDLGGYLDKSSALSRSDFLENILEVYTYGDVLVCIPTTVTLQTVVGRAADVGTKPGWSLEEIIAYADAHPGAELFDGASKKAIMRYMMMFNEDAFIDWSAGECHFDTDEFRKLLEFTNRFPEEYNYDSDHPSTPSLIQSGDVLLETAYISEFNDIQIYEEIFEGEYTFIGFPTLDGGSGCAMYSPQTYAITAKSETKDGAWAFIEQLLTEEGGNRFRSWGFPTVKSRLDALIEEAVRNYYVDDEGNPLLDENGELIIREGTSAISYQDGWSYTYHVVTQEEVDKVMELMKTAKPLTESGGGTEVSNIIIEEAEAYYKGQKSVDEVVNIIQSRIQMYVSTNS